MFPNNAYSVLEIDLGSIRSNAAWLRAHTGAGVKMMAVVKANAYGHGSLEVAAALADEVDAFAVAQPQEALYLRKNGIASDILIFGSFLPEHADWYTRYALIATVSRPGQIHFLPPGCRYHIKFDTGMHRFGIQPEYLNEMLNEINTRDDIVLEGVYTHFATADSPDSSYFDVQMNRFKPVIEAFSGKCLVHVSNSAAMLCHSNAAFNLVRPGIALYGVHPDRNASHGLRQAVRWKTAVVSVKTIEKGDAVSYGASWKAPSKGGVVVVPVGYADGIPRVLSGKLSVRINDRDFAQVGTITMDNMMIWTGSATVRVGDEVTLIGSGNQSPLVWADAMGSIPYEVFCMMGKRAARLYITG